jgi:methionyl aminopeptidase
MIVIKNKLAIMKMEEAGKRLATIFNEVAAQVIAGKSTLQLDAWISNQLITHGLESRMKGYHGYKHISCISLNDEVVHGVPSDKKIIKNGDIVKIDVCASWRGYCADMARCFVVGDIAENVTHFLNVVQLSLDNGVAASVAGARLSNISAAVQQTAEKYGYGVVRDFAGHGIGKQMHEDPEIVNYGKAGEGPLLRAGMTFAIEPMITMGSYEVYVTNDKWTVKTNDRSLAGHVEDTVLVTDDVPKVLTRLT